MRRSRGSRAVSAIRPVSLPVAGSRSYRPPGGSGVASEMPGERERPRVHVRRVAAAVLHVHGVVSGNAVEIGQAQGPPFRRLRVVVLEAQHPIARPGLGRALPKRGHDRFDRSQVAVHLLQVEVARRRDVGVPVDEARHHGAAAQVDLLRSGRGQVQDVGVAAHGQEAPARDGHRARPRLGVVHGDDVAVPEDELGLGADHGQEGKRRCVAEELTTSCLHESSYLVGVPWLPGLARAR